MNSIRSLAALSAAVVLGFFLFGCGPADSRAPTVQETVETLSSPDFEGRVSGSGGNARAAAYIADYFESLDLEPCFETYCQEYQGPVYQPEEASPQVTLTTAGGETIALKAGTDFLCALPRTDLNLELPVYSDPEACRAGAGIYFAPDRLSCINWLNANPGSAALFCEDVRSGGVSAIYPNDHALLILDETFSRQLAEGAALTIRINASRSEGTVWNVAALRRGSEGKSALIFGAHFDGSGILGEQLFPSALDNASGTAAIMRIAALVQEQAPQLKNDLIFVAFNSEEVGMAGSKAFAQAVAGRYETVSLINIDCVGLAGETVSLVAGQRGGKLQDALSELPFAGDIQTSDDVYVSDQISFTPYSNCVSVVLGNASTYLAGHAHTPLDQPQQLDYPLIEDLALQLASFAAGQGDEAFSTSGRQDSGTDLEQAQQQFWDELQSLRVQVTREYGLSYNQGLCVTAETPQAGGKTSPQNYLLYGMQVFDETDALTAQFPFLTMPETLGEYTFSRAAVRLDRLAEESTLYRSSQDGEADAYRPGELYPFEIDPESLEILSAEYLAPDGSALFVACTRGRDFMMDEPAALGQTLDPALEGWEILGDRSSSLYYAAKYRQGEDVLLLLFESSPGEESSDPTLLSLGNINPLSSDQLTQRLTRIDLEGLVQLLLQPVG